MGQATVRRTITGRVPAVPVRRLLSGAAIGILLAFTACFVISGYVSWNLTHPYRKALTAAPPIPYTDVRFRSTQDGLMLRGWLMNADSDKTVIMVHGYRDNRLEDSVPAMSIARGLVDDGYNFLTFDLRDSGQSDGSLATVGLYEQRDVLGAIDYVRSLGRPGDRIALLGFSMGASTALLAAAQTEDVQAIVADSAFDDLYPYLEDNLPKWSNLPDFPFTSMMLATLPLVSGVNPRLVAPIRAVPQLQEPVLFIHGLADTKIPYQNSQRLRAAARNPADELWLVPGADHTRSFSADPPGYWNHLLPFLAAALG